MSQLKHVDIYTDGACSGNPGPGGYAAILLYKDVRRQVTGYVANTTNNRMELLSIIEGVAALKEPCEIVIYSDSAYVVNSFQQGWVAKWSTNGWRSTTGEVKNIDLWKLLIEKLSIHRYSFVKVKGHADNPLNNECDQLARKAIVDNQKG